MASQAFLLQCDKYYGGVDASEFGRPLPLIGYYISIASFVCAACIWGDLFRMMHGKKFWVVGKLYALNAVTLTVLSVAIKIPTDINASMPGLWDQFTKLSGILLVCVAMSHSMPSFGTMDESSVVSNLAALVILVITLYVNMWIQISTGVIGAFHIWFIVYSSYMLYILYLVVLKCMAATNARRVLEDKYSQKLREIGSPGRRIVKIREFVGKHWLLALTSSPRTPLYGSIIDLAAMSISCLLSIVYIIWATSLTISRRDVSDCFAKSDYRLSIAFIALFQLITILSSVVEYFHSIRHYFFPFSVKFNYNRRIVRDLRSSLGPLRLPNKLATRIICALKNITLFFFDYFTESFNFMFIFTQKIVSWQNARLNKNTPSTEQKIMTGLSAKSADLASFVIQQGEQKPESGAVQDWLRIVQVRIEIGKTQKPVHLLDFLGTNRNTGLRVSPPLGWSVTLATLATLIRVTSQPFVSKPAAAQGFKYAVFVDENHFPAPGSVSQATKLVAVGKMVWDNLDVYDDWLGNGLYWVESNDNFAGVICYFKDKSERVVNDHFKEFGEETTAAWPLEVVAAKCMYDITSNIANNLPQPLQPSNITPMPSCNDIMDEYKIWVDKLRALTDVNHDKPNEPPPVIGNFSLPKYEFLSEVNNSQGLQRAVGNVMNACFKDLPPAILNHCQSGHFTEREEKVREAAHLLGEVEDILVLLGYEPCGNDYIPERISMWRVNP